MLSDMVVLTKIVCIRIICTNISLWNITYADGLFKVLITEKPQTKIKIVYLAITKLFLDITNLQ